jgi:hypothetical protein
MTTELDAAARKSVALNATSAYIKLGKALEELEGAFYRLRMAGLNQDAAEVWTALSKLDALMAPASYWPVTQ